MVIIKLSYKFIIPTWLTLKKNSIDSKAKIDPLVTHKYLYLLIEFIFLSTNYICYPGLSLNKRLTRY